MAKHSTTLFASEEDDRRDLRNVLIACGIFLLGFAPMILLSPPISGLLQIPGPKLFVVASTAALFTLGSLFGLQRGWPARPVAWAAMIVYTTLVSLMVYLTGAPLTPMFAIHLLVVVAASFLLGEYGALIIAMLSGTSYGLILLLEYLQYLPIIPLWRLSFAASARGPLFLINWLAVTIPLLLTARLSGALAERLRATNASLRESERLRENLSNMIVHDLRNPLTALMGGLDILRLTMADHMDPDQKHLLENSRHSGHMLLGLVGELLDISKMEAGKLTLHIQPVNLHELIGESIEMVQALTDLESLTINTALFDDVQQVPCDRQLVSRVLINLLSNAIKHTPPGGVISVIARQHGNAALINVADTGVGISPEYQQRIFEKFGQIERPGQERHGTGLGLTFCKMAIEAHNGKIWVESQAGQGSTFSFTLPLDTPLSVPAATAATEQ